MLLTTIIKLRFSSDKRYAICRSFEELLMALASVNATEYAEFHCLHTSEPGLPGPMQLSNRIQCSVEPTKKIDPAPLLTAASFVFFALLRNFVQRSQSPQAGLTPAVPFCSSEDKHPPSVRSVLNQLLFRGLCSKIVPSLMPEVN